MRGVYNKIQLFLFSFLFVMLFVFTILKPNTFKLVVFFVLMLVFFYVAFNKILFNIHKSVSPILQDKIKTHEIFYIKHLNDGECVQKVLISGSHNIILIKQEDVEFFNPKKNDIKFDIKIEKNENRYIVTISDFSKPPNSRSFDISNLPASFLYYYCLKKIRKEEITDQTFKQDIMIEKQYRIYDANRIIESSLKKTISSFKWGDIIENYEDGKYRIKALPKNIHIDSVREDFKQIETNININQRRYNS